MSDKVKLINAEAKATENLARQQAELAAAQRSGDAAAITAIEEKIRKTESYISKAKGIKTTTAEFTDLASQISLSERATSELGKSFTTMDKQLKSLTKIQVSLTDPAEINFAHELATAGTLIAEAQRDVLNAASGTKDEQKAAAANLEAAQGMYDQLIKDNVTLLAGNSHLAGIAGDFNKNLIKANRELEIMNGLTDDEITAYKELTKEVDEMKGRLNAVANQITAALKKPSLAIGLLIVGVGKVVGKVFEMQKAFGMVGQEINGFTASAGILGMGFKESQQVAEGLAENLGDMGEASFGTQLNTNLIANNMGISGTEAAYLTSEFGKMRGSTSDQAANMLKSLQATAKLRGVLPSAVMKDLAANGEAFAKYAKGSGDNIKNAAIQARQLGVTFATTAKIADTLLDFETSIEKELEASAMLGKDLNLSRARELFYMGKQEEAMSEILRQLGDKAEWDRMDVYQKDAAAAALGISVAELEKMYMNQQNIAENAGTITEDFNAIKESVSAIVNEWGGGFISALGKGIILMGQLGGGIKAFDGMFGGVVSKVWDMVKGLVVAGAQKVWGMVTGGKSPASDVIDSAKDKVVDKVQDSITDKVQDKASEKAEDLVDSKVDSVTSPEGVEGATDAVNKDKSMGDKLKDLSEGLKAMGDTQVLRGALNLIPTGLGFLLLTPGLIGMWGVSKFADGAGKGLESLAEGLKKMGDSSVMMGSLSLAVASLGFLLITPGLIGMAGVAFLGVAAGTGLIGLAAGLTAMSGTFGGSIALGAAAIAFTLMIPGAIGMALFGVAAPLAAAGLTLLGPALASFGATAGTVGWLGVAVILALSAAFIGFAFGLSLIVPLVKAIGEVIVGVITAIASGIAVIVGSITNMMAALLPLMNIEAAIGVLAMAGAFSALALSLAMVAMMGTAAIPVLLVAGAVGAVAGSLFGGESGGGGKESKDDLIIQKLDELKAAYMTNKDVYIDGAKVTAAIGKGASKNPISS
jgi:predicted SpoU family rRNA methylase